MTGGGVVVCLLSLVWCCVFDVSCSVCCCVVLLVLCVTVYVENLDFNLHPHKERDERTRVQVLLVSPQAPRHLWICLKLV